VTICKDPDHSPHRPGQALRVPGGWCFQISSNQDMKVVKLSALRTGRFYTQEVLLVPISVEVWVDPGATERQEGLFPSKIPIRHRTRDLPACSAVNQAMRMYDMQEHYETLHCITQCICAFCMILNKQHLLPYTTHQQNGFYNRDGSFIARDEPKRVLVT
jgi:hypothetical protein